MRSLRAKGCNKGAIFYALATVVYQRVWKQGRMIDIYLEWTGGLLESDWKVIRDPEI